MELLAPAGNLDNFYAALEAGADAVYLGAPGLNARNLSRDLSFQEIGAMIDYGHARNKKVYIAANSLVLERDLGFLLKSLSLLSVLQPDALIVQDIGLVHLVRKYFPELEVHASTLMGSSNNQSVNYFGELGCKRVVLARELTLKEILAIKDRTSAEIEVFVHGAMCYSFSGLCLFSSYLGGKSGLRGRCVQPCRRSYTWQGQKGKGKTKTRSDGYPKKGGSYLFSMNDLEGFEALASLQDAGISSIKIEGRMRSANYVSKIVSAYRMVLDAEKSEREEVIQAAEQLALAALARKTSSGYFFSPQPQQAISPHHSGNLGLYLGSISDLRSKTGKVKATLKLKHELYLGDRLRLHIEPGGQRQPFTLHSMWRGQEAIDHGLAGDMVGLEFPQEKIPESYQKIDIYKQDVAENPQGKKILAEQIQIFSKRFEIIEQQQNKRIATLRNKLQPAPGHHDGKLTRKPGTSGRRNRGKGRDLSLEIWLKTDSAKLVKSRLPFTPDIYLLSMNKKMLSQAAAIKKYLGKNSRSVVWALPPVIFENGIPALQKQITQLLRSGYRSFQLGHLSQEIFFQDERVKLFGDYSLNPANSQTLEFYEQKGMAGTQLAIELDRDALQTLLRQYKQIGRALEKQKKSSPRSKLKLGMTVYGTPPLFTSRLIGTHLHLNKSVVSPKGEQFVLKKRDGLVLTLPIQPFSLLPYLQELQNIGLDYAVLDTTLMRSGPKEMEMLAERLMNSGKHKKLPTFNYLGKLQ